ncbi:HAAAP family transport protein [Salmonella enterica subsp. enterica]|uniref:HAAAP family transport protein n=1 Tax=Salmonella enterica I TaxID=59201 RepID=A0A379VHY3_SALET|nr:HAAAP family transport protein [Salmonella enterica subsp. enterica]
MGCLFIPCRWCLIAPPISKPSALLRPIFPQSIIYKVAIFAVLVAIASGGEKLLFKISGPMVVVKVGIILIFGFRYDPTLES